MNRSIVLILSAVVLTLTISFPSQTPADERILDFRSRITVEEDGSLTVRETIRVRSEGREIKRGIYRDFPTTYKTPSGLIHRVGFKVREVLRDGKPESYHIEKLSNGKRVYIGKKNYFLPRGEYTYTLEYRTDRQLGFFDDHDELYWNVTGNGWSFPIDRASATVVLPGGAEGEIIELGAYTGPEGSRGKGFFSTPDATFTTTRPLASGEGLTIVVAFSKGYVREPTGSEETRAFIGGNLGIAVGFFGLSLLLCYYLVVWFREGKDPARGVIIPLFTPPKNFTPAAARYVMKMGFDNKCFTAAIINMAVKGYLNIREEKGEYTVARGEADGSVLTHEEKKIAGELLGASNEIKLKKENHKEIGGARRKLTSLLKGKYEKLAFVTNSGYFIAGLFVSLVIILAGFALQDLPPQALGLSVWLAIWSFGVIFLLRLTFSRWRDVILREAKTKAGAVFLTIFTIPFLTGELAVIFVLGKDISPWMFAILFAAVFINCLFYHLLKAPTRAGRKIMDKIEGFKMFLAVAEKDRLNLLNPPEQTPELFERYLPYALALDVEQAWAEKFSAILARATDDGRPYQPAWYSGAGWSSLGAGTFASSLSTSLSGAIASSSTAPGSSSGGGGGGSSGGGGGGGGGGGW